ncbi:hypothetical protein L7F22_035078 [Adiantum nelumboides]|nr:hypothetical protein [Adiantum nelumboides]
MAKKGAGFRLWFRKLSIKRFHNNATQRKRKSNSPAHHLVHHQQHHLHGALPISSPYRALNSDSSPPAASAHGCRSSPVIIFSSSSSPPNPFFAFSPSPWRYSTYPALSPVSQTSPTSPTPNPPHRNGAAARHGNSSRNKPQCTQETCTAAVLLSPFNRKAMDVSFPSGGSSPAKFLQSPLLCPAAAIASPVRISSPPLSSAHSHTILFRSPLHPLAHQTVGIPRIEAKINAKQQNATNRLDSSSREAKTSARARSKTKILAWVSRKSDAAACHIQAQLEEASCLKESTNQNSARRKLTRGSSIKQSSLIVDCGCSPHLSSSFRKTKKTLQACGSCSSNNRGAAPVQDRCYEQAMQKLRSMRGDANIVEESKLSVPTAAACICGQRETCILFSEQGRHGNEMLSHTMLQHLRKRKKKMHLVMNKSPIKTLNTHCPVLRSASSNATCKEIGKCVEVKSGNPPKDSAVVLTDAHALPWDKEMFSSFTSEDTFFSSFERSRPSFSSNSSSECFDKKKLRHANLALSSASMVANKIENLLQMDNKPGCNIDNPHNAPRDQNAKPKQGDPLIVVSFQHGQENIGNKGASEHGITPASCRVISHERRPTGMSPKPGVKKSSTLINPLVGIKEASCEEGNTSTPDQQANLSREGCNSNTGFLNMQKETSSNPSPDYIFSSHSDYYANARVRQTKNARIRRKYTSADVVQGAGDDTSSTRLRRRAQLQAKWMLREERIQWHSSVDESEVDSTADGIANEGNAAHRLTKVCMGESPVCRETRADEIRIKHDASKEDAGKLESKLDASEEATTSVAQTTPESNNSESEYDGGKKNQCANVDSDTKNSFVKISRLMDSVAVVKSSKDPLVDFRDSMVDMIIERQIYTAEDLGELLRCFLSLNPSEHHDTIVHAFMEVWASIFQGS